MSDFVPDVTQEESLEAAFPERPWLTILFQPRSTIRAIVDSDPERDVLLLAMLTGIGNAFLNNEENVISLALRFGLPVSFLLTVFYGSLAGLLGFFLAGVLFTWVGKGFGGKASSDEVRAVVAWSGMPIILSLAFVPLIFIVYRSELVSETYYDSFAIGLIWVPAIVVYIWWGLLFWKSYAEVQEFSLLKAFISIFSAFVAVTFIVLILAFIIGIGISMLGG